MNILTSVIVIIMVVAAVTVVRMDTFVGRSHLLKAYGIAMERAESAALVKAADAHWEKAAGKVKTSQGEEDQDIKQPRLYRLLDISCLVKPKMKDPLCDAREMMWKELIITTYQGEAFFREAIEKNPLVVDDMIGIVKAKATLQDADVKIVDVDDMANLNLGNGVLQEFLYKMLRGASKDDVAGGYPPMKTFLGLKNGSAKVSVYLAPESILRVLFHQPEVVAEVVKTRNELYRDVRGERMDQDVATKAFEDKFRGACVPAYLPLVEWRVTKTNPR